MNKIKVTNIFAAVFEKSVLDPLLDTLLGVQPLKHKRSLLGLNPKSRIKFWGTDGTVKYLKSKGFNAQSAVSGFDFDGRVKSLGRNIFARILADRTNLKHLKELKKLNLVPFDLVIVGLYAPDPKSFPESMDIGGQALIRAAIKNYKNVALAFDRRSLASLVSELVKNSGSTTIAFRKRQTVGALKFIAERCNLEANLKP